MCHFNQFILHCDYKTYTVLNSNFQYVLSSEMSREEVPVTLNCSKFRSNKGCKLRLAE
jgi:hypothetical protein